MNNINRIYETGGDFAAVGHGQIVSRTLHGVIERGDMPLDAGFGDIEMAAPQEVADTPAAKPTETAVPKPRIDLEFLTNPLSATPDAAAISFAAMKGVVSKGLYREYYAD